MQCCARKKLGVKAKITIITWKDEEDTEKQRQNQEKTTNSIHCLKNTAKFAIIVLGKKRLSEHVKTKKRSRNIDKRLEKLLS